MLFEIFIKHVIFTSLLSLTDCFGSLIIMLESLRKILNGTDYYSVRLPYLNISEIRTETYYKNS